MIPQGSLQNEDLFDWSEMPRSWNVLVGNPYGDWPVFLVTRLSFTKPGPTWDTASSRGIVWVRYQTEDI